MSKSPSPAIFTLASRYGAADLRVFLASLQATSFSGRLVVFHAHLQDDAIALLQKFGATLVPFSYPRYAGLRKTSKLWPFWRWMFGLPLGDRFKDGLARRVLHLTYLRFLLYLDYLQTSGQDIDQVMLTDCRDVAFQSDPFAGLSTPGVHVYEEDPGTTIGQCPYHHKWICDVFGEPVFQSLAAFRKICSGTTLGDRASIIDYLQVMRATIFQSLNMHTWGGDQGMHNYVCHRGLVPKMITHPLGEGAVSTMGCADASQFTFSPDGQILDGTGAAPAVLHQYDRIPFIKSHLEKRFTKLR